MFNDKPGRRQIAAQQRAEAETCRHLGKGSDRLTAGARQANASELQIEAAVVAVDGEAHSRYGDLEPVSRPAESFLDIGGQAIELDGALYQAPQAESDDHGQRRCYRAEPYREAMCAAPHPQRGRAEAPGCTRRRAPLGRWSIGG